MDKENLKVSVDTACDLIQIIYEDVEDNFVTSGCDKCTEARGSMVLSALIALGVYLRTICGEVPA